MQQNTEQNQETTIKNPHGDHYNDDNFNYERYWDERKYEHLTEVDAITKLIDGARFKRAIDIGGGYGRLTLELSKIADVAILMESSAKQLEIAENFLKNYPQIQKIKNTAQSLNLEDSSCDLAIMMRVMHHFPEPEVILKEVYRVLENNGVFLLEFANSTHFKNKIKYTLKGQKLPSEPINISTSDVDAIPFVNHNPETIKKLVESIGFKVEKEISISIFRSTTIKSIIPAGILSKMDSLVRPLVSKFNLGPSVIYKLRK